MQTKHPRGFSLIELMVVITVIGILALLAVPSVVAAAHRAEATATANDLRIFANALEFYTTAEGSYPERMTYSQMPDSIEGYLPSTWTDGSYNWSYGNTNHYTYIYVYNLDFTPEQAVRIDKIIDDGNIGTGKLWVAFNGVGLIYIFQKN